MTGLVVLAEQVPEAKSFNAEAAKSAEGLDLLLRELCALRV